MVMPFDPVFIIFLIVNNCVYIIELYYYYGVLVLYSPESHVGVIFFLIYRPHITLFTLSKHFIIADLQSIFRSQFVCTFIIYLHTKFHIPTQHQNDIKY